MTEGSILESFAEELDFEGSGQKFTDDSIHEDSFKFDDEPLSFTEQPTSKKKVKKTGRKKVVEFQSPL